MIKFFKDKLFKQELKREIRMLIVVGIGFSIAFAWRQTSFDAALTFIHWLFNTNGSVTSSILASLLITIIGVIIILLTSKFLRDEF